MFRANKGIVVAPVTCFAATHRGIHKEHLAKHIVVGPPGHQGMKFWMDGPDQQGSHRYPAWQPCLQNAGSGNISDVARDRFCNVRLCCKVPNLGGHLYESCDGQGCKQLGDLKNMGAVVDWTHVYHTTSLFVSMEEEKNNWRAPSGPSALPATPRIVLLGSNPSVPFRGKRIINRMNINKQILARDKI